MTKFEKMAMQFEAMGDIFAVPGIEDAVSAVLEKDISKAIRSARVTKAIGLCMRGAPESMKLLGAAESGKDVAEVEEMGIADLSGLMLKVLTGYILPFFGSGAKQDGRS